MELRAQLERLEGLLAMLDEPLSAEERGHERNVSSLNFFR